MNNKLFKETESRQFIYSVCALLGWLGILTALSGIITWIKSLTK